MDQLYVYGTLRKGGTNNYTMENMQLERVQTKKLQGFSIYVDGHLPYAYYKPDESIVVDVYRRGAHSRDNWPYILKFFDMFEMVDLKVYERVLVDDGAGYMYTATDRTMKELHTIGSGVRTQDWVSFCNQKGW